MRWSKIEKSVSHVVDTQVLSRLVSCAIEEEKEGLVCTTKERERGEETREKKRDIEEEGGKMMKCFSLSVRVSVQLEKFFYSLVFFFFLVLVVFPSLSFSVFFNHLTSVSFSSFSSPF